MSPEKNVVFEEVKTHLTPQKEQKQDDLLIDVNAAESPSPLETINFKAIYNRAELSPELKQLEIDLGSPQKSE